MAEETIKKVNIIPKVDLLYDKGYLLYKPETFELKIQENVKAINKGKW